MESFKDTSPFQGVVQYKDDFGNEWRRIDEDLTHQFYKLDKKAFIHQGTLIKKSVKSRGLKYIHDAFLRTHEKED